MQNSNKSKKIFLCLNNINMVRDLLCSKRATKQDTDLKVANATELVAEGQVKSLPLLFYSLY